MNQNEDLTPGTHKNRIKEAMDRLYGKENKPASTENPKSMDEMTGEEAVTGAILGAKAICGDESAMDELKVKLDSITFTKEQEIEFKLASYVSQKVPEELVQQISEGIGLDWDEKVQVVFRAGTMAGAANMFWTLKETGCLKPEFLKKASEMYDESKGKKGGPGGLWK